MPELILAPIASKTCTKCGEVKPIGMFAKRSCNPDGIDSKCRSCKSAYARRLKESNPEYKQREADRRNKWLSANREKCLAAQKKYHLENKNQRNEVSRRWKALNPEKNKQITAEWRVKNHERVIAYVNEYQKSKRNSCDVYALHSRVRILILNKLRQMGYTKRSRTHEILGCDWHFFKAHIEKQFHKGMTWDNRSDWHIDHITPISTAKTEEDVIALNHFTNLRPMWAKDNLAKGAQITHLI